MITTNKDYMNEDVGLNNIWSNQSLQIIHPQVMDYNIWCFIYYRGAEEFRDAWLLTAMEIKQWITACSISNKAWT
jgi:hypothetical protein